MRNRVSYVLTCGLGASRFCGARRRPTGLACGRGRSGGAVAPPVRGVLVGQPGRPSAAPPGIEW